MGRSLKIVGLEKEVSASTMAELSLLKRQKDKQIDNRGFVHQRSLHSEQTKIQKCF